MRADKYDPRYIDRYSPRHVYTDFADWLRSHPAWVFGFIFAYIYYLLNTEEI